MRQVGVLAAAGMVALDTGIDRLAEDHENARALAEGLANIPGIRVDLSTVQTNMVNLDLRAGGPAPERFVAALRERDVLVAEIGGTEVRAVTSYEVTRADIDRALAAASAVMRDTSLAVA